MLSDEAVRLLADACKTLPVSDVAAEGETVEILQVALGELARSQLQKAGKRAVTKVLRDITRFFPRIDRIFSGKALNPFFGAQDEGFSEFRSG